MTLNENVLNQINLGYLCDTPADYHFKYGRLF